jgi:hypothetical protein
MRKGFCELRNEPYKSVNFSTIWIINFSWLQEITYNKHYRTLQCRNLDSIGLDYSTSRT